MNNAISRPALYYGTSTYPPQYCRPSRIKEPAVKRIPRLHRIAVTERDEASASNELHHQYQEQHAGQHQHRDIRKPRLIWCQGLLAGTFQDEVQAVFPKVAWQPNSLLQVLYYGLPAAAAAVLANTQLAAFLLRSSNSTQQTTLDAADAAITTAAAGLQAAADLDSMALQYATVHCAQEAVFATVMPLACWFALGNRVIACRWDGYWVVQTLVTCAVLFPLVDPVLYNLWQPVAEAVSGPAIVNPLVTTLHQAAAAGSWGSVGLHCLASGVLGPVWEEVFWRGFFLTALTKVLPVPACVALSSLNFAVLHLSPHNFLPLLVLSACCDCMYLRSGGNLLAPLLLHGLWNSSQVLQIALLQKDMFV